MVDCSRTTTIEIEMLLTVFAVSQPSRTGSVYTCRVRAAYTRVTCQDRREARSMVTAWAADSATAHAIGLAGPALRVPPAAVRIAVKIGASVKLGLFEVDD